MKLAAVVIGNEVRLATTPPNPPGPRRTEEMALRDLLVLLEHKARTTYVCQGNPLYLVDMTADAA
jgi:hypothetical protein